MKCKKKGKRLLKGLTFLVIVFLLIMVAVNVSFNSMEGRRRERFEDDERFMDHREDRRPPFMYDHPPMPPMAMGDLPHPRNRFKSFKRLERIIKKSQKKKVLSKKEKQFNEDLEFVVKKFQDKSRHQHKKYWYWI